MGVSLIVLGVFFVNCRRIYLTGFKNIPAEPPTVAVVTFLGERIKRNGKPVIKKKVGDYFGYIPGYTGIFR